MQKNYWLFFVFLVIIFQNYACDLPQIEENQKVSVKKKTVSKPIEPPKPVEEVFKASCIATAGGCEKIQSLKQKMTNYDEFFLLRAAVLRKDLNNLISTLNNAQYVYPMFSVELKWNESPDLWKTVSGNKESNVVLKTKYTSWENAFYAQDADLVKKAYTQYFDDLKYFRNELDSLKKQEGFSLKSLSKAALSLAEDINFSIINGTKTDSFPIPKMVIQSFDFPAAHSNNLKVAIVNSEFDLNYHIIEEKVIPVLIQPFVLTETSLVLKNATIVKMDIPFSVPSEAICKSLRAEVRIERPNEEIRNVMKIIADPNTVLKNEEKIVFASTQVTDKLSIAQEEAKKLKEKNIMLEVAKLITDPNVNALANPIKKDGSFDGWDFPSKNISPSDFQVVTLLRELKPQAPLEKKLCVSIDNKQIFTLQTSEASLPMVLDILNIPQNVLVPEETLGLSWNEKNGKNTMVAERDDYGSDLFDTLKKKKEVVLKLNKAVKSVPYMIHLQTDTGSKINLPVEVDGLKSKQSLADGTKWRLLGVAEQFTINLESVYHQKLLSRVLDDGSVKLFDIQYERSFPEYLTDWTKIRKYEVHLSGDRDSFLGITQVNQYFRQVIRHTDSCDIDISFEFKTMRDHNLNAKLMDNPNLAKKSILYMPNPTDQYVFGYADAPNCQ